MYMASSWASTPCTTLVRLMTPAASRAMDMTVRYLFSKKDWATARGMAREAVRRSFAILSKFLQSGSGSPADSRRGVARGQGSEGAGIYGA